jgi:hypothetical protein
LGGFAALGNPSSLHNSFVRRMRQYATVEVLPSLRRKVLDDDAYQLEQVVDRMLYRPKGDQATAESWRRDEAKDAAAADHMYGGWWNLDETPQTFSCVPASHADKEAAGRHRGFATISDATTKKQMKARAVQVPIPPGHIVVFYERIVHEVVSKKAAETMYRLFLGHRVVGSGADKGQSYRVVRRFMRSLDELEPFDDDSRLRKPQELCPRYTKAEIAMHKPNRRWTLCRGTDDKKRSYRAVCLDVVKIDFPLLTQWIVVRHDSRRLWFLRRPPVGRRRTGRTPAGQPACLTAVALVDEYQRGLVAFVVVPRRQLVHFEKFARRLNRVLHYDVHLVVPLRLEVSLRDEHIVVGCDEVLPLLLLHSAGQYAHIANGSVQHRRLVCRPVHHHLQHEATAAKGLRDFGVVLVVRRVSHDNLLFHLPHAGVLGALLETRPPLAIFHHRSKTCARSIVSMAFFGCLCVKHLIFFI